MPTIRQVHAREVLDSRADPTVEVEVHLTGGAWGRAIVPSGASTGQFEAVALRDADPARYDGRGVLRAVAHVNGPIRDALLGREIDDQRALDECLIGLDGTPQKSRLGANALLGTSLAALHAGAAAAGEPVYRRVERLLGQVAGGDRPLAPRMPVPMTNMISGGLHAGGNLDFQDVLAVPGGAADFAQALEWLVRIYHRLGALLTAAGYEGRLVGDEGGFGPRLSSNAEAVELVVRAIESAGLRPGEDVTIALDVAATHFFDGQRYRLRATGDESLSATEMIEHIEALVERFPITSVEDPLADDDWEGWCELTRRLGARLQLVGDDLFVTQTARLRKGAARGAANAVLIKLNQVGTVTETLEALALAQQLGYASVVSARSGETEDCTIADLAVGSAAGQIKIGSVVRSERLAKYNQLLRIEAELNQHGG